MKLTSRPIALLALVFTVGATAAESPSDFAWTARWIGPASGKSPGLAGASWIWADEPGVDPVKNAAPGTCEFTKNIVVQPGRRIAKGTAIFSADDRFELLVNGKAVGSGDAWQRPSQIDITSTLHPGTNTLTVKAINNPASGAVNAAGLIGKVLIELEGGAPLEIATDASWLSKGRPARVIGPLGTAPWGNLREESRTGSNLWTAYRKTFDLAQKPATATARIAADSKYWLWVNGTLV
ncbi:MAG: hypothetical protein WCO94_12265, partial [Verrucomicrobiota bacterium]